MFYVTVLVAGTLAFSPFAGRDMNRSSASLVDLRGENPSVRVFVGPGVLNQTSLAPLPFDDSTFRVDVGEFEEEIAKIGRFIRRGFIIRRNYRPCVARVDSVKPIGPPIYFQVTLDFTCTDEGFTRIDVRFARELPPSHVHALTLIDPQGRQNTVELAPPYDRQLGRGTVEALIWVYGSAGVRGVFGSAPVLAFFVLLSLSGLMARPDLDVRFPFIAALFVIAGLLRPLYWPEPSPLEDLLGIVPVAVAGILYLYFPLWATHSAFWLAPIAGTVAGAQWLNYGWPGSFGLLAWLALVIGVAGSFTLLAYLTSYLAEGSFDRLRSTSHTMLLVVLGTVIAVANLVAGAPHASLYLIAYFITAAAVLNRRGVRAALISRVSVLTVIGCSAFVLIAGLR